MTPRARSAGAAALSFVLIAAVVFFATRADGRVANRASSNDGGAWLTDRSRGGAAHVEYTSGQPTASVVAPHRTKNRITALQSNGITLLHDQTDGSVTVVDDAYALLTTTTQVPAGAAVVPFPGGAAVVDETTATVWHLTIDELRSVEDVTEASPVYIASGEAEFVVGTEGQLAVVERDRIAWPSVGPGTPGEEEPSAGIEAESSPLPDGFEVAHATMAGSRLILTDGARWLSSTPSGTDELQVEMAPEAGAGPVGEITSLQRPSNDVDVLGAVTEANEVVLISLSSGQAYRRETDLKGPPNTEPLLFEHCLNVLSGESGDVLHTVTCAGPESSRRNNIKVSDEAQLKEVNGFVWIDALDGSGYKMAKEMELEEIADFSQIFDHGEGDESSDGENVVDRVDQAAADADLRDADLRKPDDINAPPIAEDDEAATRLGRPIVVDVLANDTDPNSDVILVEHEVEVLSGNATAEVPTSRNGVQISADEPGIVEVRYTVSDGHPGSTDSATIKLTVLPDTAEGNRPPVPVVDRAVGAAGSIVTANLTSNDEDPDGDALLLRSIEPSETSGITVLSAHPGGDVILSLPQTVGEGTVEVPYIVEDEWREPAEGVLQVTVRLNESNTRPDARNDAGVTQVGRRITLNLLANDVDGDNDLLTISQPATLIEGELTDYLTTTESGDFSFEPSAAGTYVFEYGASDNEEADLAIVRIEVTEPEENRPPIAVRDDVRLGIGERRLVRALDNDGDRDGDLFSVIDQVGNQNLSVEVEHGVGFWVAMESGAGAVEKFQYALSDGVDESGYATVVVARSEEAFVDAAPIANDDAFQVRAGRTSYLPVLLNDYDPEGGRLMVAGVDATVAGVEATIASSGLTVAVDVPESATFPFGLTYTVSDEGGNQAAATVEVAIVGADAENQAPIARPDRAYTKVDTPVVVAVLANDTDPESDPLKLAGVPNPPEGGAVEVAEDGVSYVYTPAPGFFGTDSFNYLVADSEGAETFGYAAIAVLPEPRQNTEPVAVDDIDWSFAAGGGTIRLDVLNNDYDADGDALTVVDTAGPASVAADGSAVTVTLPDEVEGETTLSFRYTIDDSRGGRDEATVTIAVLDQSEPIAPIANPDTAPPVREDETVRYNVVANDEDPDGDPATLKISAADSGVSIEGHELVIVAPAENQTFNYTIEDRQGLTARSTLTVQVEENLAPEVSPAVVDLGEFFTDDELPVIDLTQYASDPDGDPLTFVLLGDRPGGRAQSERDVVDDRRVRFSPDPDFEGQSGFSYKVADDHDNETSGSVVVTLKGLSNEPPEAKEGLQLSVEAGVDQTVNFANFFTDPDVDDQLTYAVTGTPGDPVEVASSAADSIVLHVPIESQGGATTLEVTATDTGDETAVATVSIEATPSSKEPPVAAADGPVETDQDTPISVPVLDNDFNSLGEGELTVIGATASSGGVATNDASTVTFTPDADYFGTTTVEYVIEDVRGNEAGRATGTITINVLGRPAAPPQPSGRDLPPRTIAISWLQPPNNGGSPITDYELEVDGGEPQSVGTAMTFQAEYEPGVDHTFRLRAVNEVGVSDWSPVVGPIVVDLEPSAPGKPVVTFGDGQLNVAWARAESEGSAILGYSIEIDQCGSSVTEVGNQLSYSWPNLRNGDACTFKVAARNLAGYGPFSQPSDQECPHTVPSAPGRPTATRGDKLADVSWPAAPTLPCSQDDITGYEIVRLPDNGTKTVAAGTLTDRSAPLVNGETYRFKVRAENRAGWGEFSVESPDVTPCGLPERPVTPSLTGGDARVTIGYTAAPDNGCDLLRSEYSLNGGIWTGIPSNRVITSGVVNGTRSTVRVRGVNEVGDGVASAQSNAVVPKGPPRAVTNLRLIADGGAGWWAFNSANANGGTISRYSASGDATGSVQSRGSGQAVRCRNGEGNGCLFQASGSRTPPTGCVQRGRSVSVQVWATNEVDDGPRASASRSIPGCPGAPSLSVSNGNGKFTANWSRPSGVSSLYVQVGNSYGSAVGGTSKTFNGNNGQTYNVTAWACNPYGCSKSATRQARPVAPPPPAVSLSKGGSAQGRPGCSSSACAYLRVSYSNFPSGTRTVRCYSSRDSSPYFTYTANSNPSSICYFGYTNDSVWVTVDGVRSNTIRW